MMHGGSSRAGRVLTLMGTLGGPLRVYLGAPPAGTQGRPVAATRLEPELRGWIAAGGGPNYHVLVELYELLGAALPRPPRSTDLARMADAVADAFARGRFVALESPLVETPLPRLPPSAEAPAPPPDAVPDATATFEVKLVDEVGEALVGMTVTISVNGRDNKVTTNGAGKAKVEGTGGVASVTFHKEADIRKGLRARWAQPRGKDWYIPPEGEEATHTIVQVRRRSTFPSVTLFAGTLYTVVFQPRVVQANLEGMWFATSKSFLLPTARHSLQRVKDLYDDNHECDMLVAGHTDTEGSAHYNDALSLERAEAVVAYLKDDVDAWYAWYGSGKPAEKRWGATEDELMIQGLAEESGQIIPNGTSHVTWYQESRGITPADGKAGEHTRKALLKEYMGLDGTSLPDDITPVAHGCGENFPIKDLGDNKNVQENRRVEIFFYDNPIAPSDRPSAVLPPPPGKNSKPGSKEYPEWRKRVVELHEFVVGAWIRVLMRYDDGTPAANVPFLIKYEDGRVDTQTTSDAGILMVHGVKEQEWSITAVEDACEVTMFQ
jgi:outer membrane protein OmpA-like peptidoglycan-associated protein